MLQKLLPVTIKKTLSGIKKDLLKIEKEIDSLIETDESLKILFKRITSVPGVGKITAILLIYLTNEFKNFENPRQLACYSGVVPFEYCSGKSIKSRPKVHYIANKKLKKALHMCAISASKTILKSINIISEKRMRVKTKCL